jgi:hypothetical protein
MFVPPTPQPAELRAMLAARVAQMNQAAGISTNFSETSPPPWLNCPPGQVPKYTAIRCRGCGGRWECGAPPPPLKPPVPSEYAGECPSGFMPRKVHHTLVSRMPAECDYKRHIDRSYELLCCPLPRTPGAGLAPPVPGAQYSQAVPGWTTVPEAVPPRPVPWKWIALGALGLAGLVLMFRRQDREPNPYLTSGLPDDWDTMAEPSEHERPWNTGRRGAGYSHQGEIQTEVDPNDIRYKHVWVGGSYVGQIFDSGARFWSLSPAGDREHKNEHAALQALAAR